MGPPHRDVEAGQSRCSVVVVVVVAELGVRVVEIGATCGSPGHHGIEAWRRARVDRFSSAP